MAAVVRALQVRDEFVGRMGHSAKIPSGKNAPESVNKILWARHLEARVSETREVGEAVLGDLAGFRQFRHDAEDLREELESWREDQFNDWAREVQSRLQDAHNKLSLDVQDRSMELSAKDGKLYVNYSERLITLLREVRTLTGLGYVIPAKIQVVAELAQRFYRQAIILKQVTCFVAESV